MEVQEEVKIHTPKAEAGERVRYAQACPGCGTVEKRFFRMHDCRRRKFRLSANMALAKTPAQFEAMSATFDDLKAQETGLMTKIAEEQSKARSADNAEAAVTTALEIVHRR